MTTLAVVSFDAPAPLLSMNTKPSRQTREYEQLWRDAAAYAYISAHPGVGPSGRRLGPAIVHTLLPVRTRGRRDAANFQATVKRIVDGITNAGAWPDDTDEWVEQRTPRFYHCVDRRQIVYVRIEPVEATDHDGWKRARGVVGGTEPAEFVIRRSRDGE